MKPICHVVGAGDFDPRLIEKGKGDILIAADAGYRYLQKAAIVPDLFIGDGDSLGEIPQEVTSIALPAVKDDTDLVAACRKGLSLGYQRFFLYGALGGKRFSHSLANLQLLAFLRENGGEGVIIDENCRISLLRDEAVTFDGRGGYFSLFALDKDAVVSIQGAKYELDRHRLSPSFPLGVSNEGKETTKITVHSGTLILVREL